MSLLGDRNVRRLIRAFYLATISVVVGVIGYMSIEGYSVWDAFYMTVITISTVGFSEVYELSFHGRMFTAVFIIFNISLVAYIVSIISRYLFEGELRDVFTNYLSKREVNKMKDHVIICGYGRNGYTASKELERDKIPFVVIDNNADLVQSRLEENQDVPVIRGDATDESVLLDAGVDRAQALIAAIPNDAANVFITLTAKELNPRIKIIARASLANSEKRLLKAGADNVVMPNVVGGHYMANLIHKPQVVEFLGMLNGVGDLKLELEDIAYEDLKTEYRDITLAEMNVRSVSDVTFIGLRDGDKQYHFNPKGETRVTKGDVLILLGVPEAVKKFENHFILKN